MKNAHEGESFELSWDLPHDSKKVWRALTESDLLAKWIMPNDLKPVAGHQFKFRMDVPPTKYWDGVVHCEMLEVVPQKRLKYSWKANPQKDGSFQLNTTVLWTLSSTPTGGTLLHLEQSGFTPEARQAYIGAKSGWDQNVKKLAELLAQSSAAGEPR